MQIMPSGGGWTHAAAAAQQSHQENKNTSPARSTSAPDSSIHVDRLEKSGDRDADERYDGPQGDTDRNEANQKDSNQESNRAISSLMSLPATEEEPSSTLDLLG